TAVKLVGIFQDDFGLVGDRFGHWWKGSSGEWKRISLSAVLDFELDHFPGRLCSAFFDLPRSMGFGEEPGSNCRRKPTNATCSPSATFASMLAWASRYGSFSSITFPTTSRAG